MSETTALPARAWAEMKQGMGTVTVMVMVTAAVMVMVRARTCRARVSIGAAIARPRRLCNVPGPSSCAAAGPSSAMAVAAITRHLVSLIRAIAEMGGAAIAPRLTRRCGVARSRNRRIVLAMSGVHSRPTRSSRSRAKRPAPASAAGESKRGIGCSCYWPRCCRPRASRACRPRARCRTPASPA